MLQFDIDVARTFIDRVNKAIDWIVEEIIRQKNWRSLLVLIDALIFLAFNKYQWPFSNILILYPQLQQYQWYLPTFWSLIIVLFIGAVIAAARNHRKFSEPIKVQLGPIKGLLPFGYEDSGDYSHLQRGQYLNECLQAITDNHWRFGILCGESGVGKTSFLQAGLWPALEQRKIRCVYVKFSEINPFESVSRACRKYLSACNAAPPNADYLSLLNQATTQDLSPVILLFDQFEQFFVHLKQKADREEFVRALTEWFRNLESIPVKLLICIRSDFLDKLHELQMIMRYSLSPTQSFRLNWFEPYQATEVLYFLAEKEGIEYDRKFVSDMVRLEMANREDGKVSPVDVQILARMIQRQTIEDGRAFNRSAFQKLGGVEGLLDRYLANTIDTRETQARRVAAIKVLLALTDLDRNTRAGALSPINIIQKLNGELSENDVNETIFWLQRGDVRLVSDSTENGEVKYELAHERMIPALRRLAGKQLTNVERAEQLLDRRTNEWLGNNRHRRYLFSLSEYRLINKQKRFIFWGGQRQAKEELLTQCQRRFKIQCAVLGLVFLLIGIGWIGWDSNVWQLYLIKRELYNAGNILNDDEALSETAIAFAYAGDSQFSDQVLIQIKKDYVKASAFNSIGKYYAMIGENEKSNSLIANAIKSVNKLGSSNSVIDLMYEVLESIDVLKDKEMARSRLSDATRITDNLDDYYGFRTRLRRRIGESYSKIGDYEKLRAWLSDDIKAAGDITSVNLNLNKSFKKYPEELDLIDIAKSYSKIGDTNKAYLLLSDAIRKSAKIDNEDSRSSDLCVTADALAEIGVREKSISMLADIMRANDGISSDRLKAFVLLSVVNSYVKLGYNEKASLLLPDLIIKAKNLTDLSIKFRILAGIVEAYANLGDKVKARSVLTNMINVEDNDPMHITETYAKVAAIINDSSLLSEAIRMVAKVEGDYPNSFAKYVLILNIIKLTDRSNDRTTFDNTFSFIDGYKADSDRDRILNAILSTKLAITDVKKLRSLTIHYGAGGPGKARALARILAAYSRPELIGMRKEIETFVVE